MEAIGEAGFNELVKTDKWKPSKPKKDPNLIALMATIKFLTDSLQASKSVNAGCSSNCQLCGGQGAWKYKPSHGSKALTLTLSKKRSQKATNGALALVTVAKQHGFAAGTSQESVARTMISTLVEAQPR
jgi:hypothetical protein